MKPINGTVKFNFVVDVGNMNQRTGRILLRFMPQWNFFTVGKFLGFCLCVIAFCVATT